MKHVNIPVFIPHLGCPHDCVFCNQRTISGKTNFDITSVDYEISAALATIDNNIDSDVEIAFFGGSFTGIARSEMIRLLCIADKYIKSGKVSSVRVSTRPDYINDEILTILKQYSVGTIELGIQCLNDEVLMKCKRGHTVRQALDACHFVKRYGFNLVGQMMTGLPGASPDDEINTATALCDIGVDGARIYPTVVFHGTELAAMTDNGLYHNLATDDIIARTSEVLAVFADHNIPVIRIGLCASDNLYSESGIHSGNYHPAIGELAVNAVYYKLISDKLNALDKSILEGSDIVIHCTKGAVSKVIGQKRSNKLKIQSEYNVKNVKVIENESILDYNIYIDINFNNKGESVCV